VRKVIDFTKKFILTILNFTFNPITIRILLAFSIFIALPILFIYHESPLIKTFGDMILLLIGLVVNAFVFTYGRRNWRSNPYGRAIMYSEASFAILANLSLVTVLMGPNWEYRSVTRVILFTFILVAQTRLFQLLLSTVDGPARDAYDKTHDRATGRKF
jgi:hypothetical protein